MEKNVVLKFEVEATPDVLITEGHSNGLKGTPEELLHEALCLAIFEGDPGALEWLKYNVENIECIEE